MISPYLHSGPSFKIMKSVKGILILIQWHLFYTIYFYFYWENASIFTKKKKKMLIYTFQRCEGKWMLPAPEVQKQDRQRWMWFSYKSRSCILFYNYKIVYQAFCPKYSGYRSFKNLYHKQEFKIRRLSYAINSSSTY